MTHSIKILCLFITSLFLVGLSSCKTTEKNYKAAYDKAIAENDRGVTEFEHTIYNRYRSQMKDIKVDVDGDLVSARSIYVKVTKDGGGIAEWLKKYCVVVAEFKQIYTAQDMRRRFAEAGYPRTFIIENAEPFYYVVVDSSDDAQKMLQVCDALKKESPIPLKKDFPYLLMVPGR